MERENEARVVYEVEYARCPGGRYDIKLDRDFQVIAITRD
jgi:hypothetical protein